MKLVQLTDTIYVNPHEIISLRDDPVIKNQCNIYFKFHVVYVTGMTAKEIYNKINETLYRDQDYP